MAGDWIKMRVWLSRDPKVVFMADSLARQREFMNWLTDPVRQHCSESAYEHVTRNVTVSLCVTALLITWGTAREQGRRENDDLILDCCSADVISEVCGVPCFGDAMLSVGWIVEEENSRVRFPKFFCDKVSPEERHAASNAERQRRFRQKSMRNTVTLLSRKNNAKVTHREEKRREEKNSIDPPLIPPSKSRIKKPKMSASDAIDKIPLPFASSEFAAAWDEWIAYRAERRLRKLSPRSTMKTFSEFSDWGEDASIRSINESIRNGWQGLFQPKPSSAVARSSDSHEGLKQFLGGQES